jgi:hypothetical protein
MKKRQLARTRCDFVSSFFILPSSFVFWVTPHAPDSDAISPFADGFLKFRLGGRVVHPSAAGLHVSPVPGM